MIAQEAVRCTENPSEAVVILDSRHLTTPVRQSPPVSYIAKSGGISTSLGHVLRYARIALKSGRHEQSDMVNTAPPGREGNSSEIPSGCYTLHLPRIKICLFPPQGQPTPVVTAVPPTR